MRLPAVWENFLGDVFDIRKFYRELNDHINSWAPVIPEPDKIFNAFTFMEPQEVTCVLFGEDPYPRTASANGVAFWDAEINSWQDKTHGNALKNILKALLVADGLAEYSTPIAQCRKIVADNGFPHPAELFMRWLDQGILPVNTAMTFSTAGDKAGHFKFWQPFHQRLISALNRRPQSPFYVLWGRKAWQWEREIHKSIDNLSRIIKQGHPTFIHQFLDKNNPTWSSFKEIRQRTGLEW